MFSLDSSSKPAANWLKPQEVPALHTSLQDQTNHAPFAFLNLKTRVRSLCLQSGKCHSQASSQLWPSRLCRSFLSPSAMPSACGAGTVGRPSRLPATEWAVPSMSQDGPWLPSLTHVLGLASHLTPQRFSNDQTASTHGPLQ